MRFVLFNKFEPMSKKYNPLMTSLRNWFSKDQGCGKIVDDFVNLIC